MRVELSRTEGLISLLADEVAYRAVRFINARAAKRRGGSGPLCASTSDPICHRLVATGSFERTQIDGIDALLSANSPIDVGRGISDVFIDVGANIGFYTTRYAARFRRTIAIEANPISYDVLSGNIRLAQSPNVVALCLGASDREGHLPLHVPSDGIMGWATFKQLEGNHASVSVPLQTIDHIVDEHASGQTVSLIKIDVEGHEPEVLRGAVKTLSKHHPVVLYEQLDRRAGAECAELLRSAGYNTFLRFTRPLGIAGILARPSVYAESVEPESVEYAALICAF